MSTSYARPVPARIPPQAVSLFDLALAFVFPLTALVSINVGGKIFGQDVLAVLMLIPLLPRKGSVAKLAQVRIFFILLGIWLGSQIITDIIRQSDPQDFVRGWSKIALLGVQFAVLWLLLTRDFKLFLAYMLGMGITSVLGIYRLEEAYAENAWKFGIGAGLLMIAAVLSRLLSRRLGGGPFFPVALLLAVGLLALLHDARSVFGVSVVGAGYVYLSDMLSRRPALARSITAPRFIVLMLAGLISCQLPIAVYSYAAEQGYLGKEARVKYEAQSSGDLSLLQSGRIESLVSTVAIADSPIIGHGSWAHDIYYVRLLAKKLSDAGIRVPPNASEGGSDLIPTHSHLLGAWVEAGVAGAVFWGWVIAVCFSALYYLLKLPGAPSATIVVAAISMLWDIPFSPFGAEVRFARAAQIALMLYVIRQARLYRRRALLYAAHKHRATAQPLDGGGGMPQMFPDAKAGI